MEQTDRSVVSRPADMVVQAESAVANGDIKAFDATIVVATYDAKRWPFLSAAVENLLSGPDRPRRVIVCVDQNEELYEPGPFGLAGGYSAAELGGPWCFGNKERWLEIR